MTTRYIETTTTIRIPISHISMAFKTYVKRESLKANGILANLLKECNPDNLTIVKQYRNSELYGIALTPPASKDLDRIYGKCGYTKTAIVTALIQQYLIDKGVNL